MTKEEFENLTGKCVTSTDFETIDYVYTWHPNISETDGKKQIATLYKEFGMPMILQMTEVAMYARNLESEMRVLKNKMELVKERMENLKSGDLIYEKCMAEMKKYKHESNTPREFQELLEKFVIPEYPNNVIAKIKKEMNW